jgi:hypothetical protein
VALFEELSRVRGPCRSETHWRRALEVQMRHLNKQCYRKIMLELTDQADAIVCFDRRKGTVGRAK